MSLEELLKDKTKKGKEKAETIGTWLTEGVLASTEIISLSDKLKDTDKATCIEGIEFATKTNPNLADEKLLNFVTRSLADKAPRTKWESAKVIGNIAANFLPARLKEPIANLLVNAEHEGTVVRWAAAFALGEILKLKTNHNQQLRPAIEALAGKEEQNGVKKKYLDALKKSGN